MPDLQQVLDERLAQGSIPAAEVMALALYHPVHGYYRRAEGPWGFEGKDYYTALDVGPLLGRCLARRLQEAWTRMGQPGSFVVLEPGAGRGWLGRDILQAAEGAFAEALRYLHRDDNPSSKRAAAEALGPWIDQGRARLVDEAEPLEPFHGAVLSNELFDALPAQPWRWDGARWVREVLTAHGPEWEAADAGEAGAWFESQTAELEPGDGSIWCEGLPDLVKSLATPLRSGLFLTIDYGDSAPRMLEKGADLRRFKSHQVDGRWWEDVGRCDLTADLDFTRLRSLLESQGFRGFEEGTLSRWIREHVPLLEWEQEWQGLQSPERLKRTENLLQLTLPGLLGERFRVLEGWKAIS
jgi:SAM-dependent MidA family methyltransferase